MQSLIDKQLQVYHSTAKALEAGAFGGGREGVALAAVSITSDKNRAALQAQLLQQGFTQANQLANQAFTQQN